MSLPAASRAGIVGLLIPLAACGSGLIDDPRDDPVPTRTRLEVWNRTALDLTLVSDEGDVLKIASCGHAVSQSFSTVQIEVRAGERTLYTLGAAAGHPGEIAPQYFVVTGDPSTEIGPTPLEPSTPLPPCQ